MHRRFNKLFTTCNFFEFLSTCYLLKNLTCHANQIHPRISLPMGRLKLAIASSCLLVGTLNTRWATDTAWW